MALEQTHDDLSVFPTDLAAADPGELRRIFRTGNYTGTTAGMATDRTQGNLVILPKDLALDFARFCQRNPKPCPLVGVSDTGNPDLWMLGEDIDIRTDIPAYKLYRHGQLMDTPSDVRDFWNEDSVAFVIGCSFSFEQALMDAGIGLRHIERGTVVPMYKTSIACTPSGPFKGGMVVSMRPMTHEQAIRAVEVTSRFDHTHGVPVHVGDPSIIGISDIDTPDWGDPTDFKPGEIPVFWACGVTPQNVIQEAEVPLVITHAPGRMLITDLPTWKK